MLNHHKFGQKNKNKQTNKSAQNLVSEKYCRWVEYKEYMYKAANSAEGRKKERNAWPQMKACIFWGFSNGMAKTIKFSSIELMICPLKW